MLRLAPHEWANCVRGIEGETLIHPKLGVFYVRKWQVFHRGAIHHTELSRGHFRTMNFTERRALFMEYQIWKRRALDLNKLPIEPGSMLFGP